MRHDDLAALGCGNIGLMLNSVKRPWRHMSKGQRAMAVAVAYPELEKLKRAGSIKTLALSPTPLRLVA
jgi:hypothetical protein